MPFLDIHACPGLLSESNLQALECCISHSHYKTLSFVIASKMHSIWAG